MSYSIGDRATIHSYKDLIVYGDTSLRLGSLLGNVSMLAGAAMNVKAGTTLNIKSEAVGSMIFAGSGSTINLSGSGSTITTTQEVTANTIALTTHTHTDTAGLAANITSAPNA